MLLFWFSFVRFDREKEHEVGQLGNRRERGEALEEAGGGEKLYGAYLNIKTGPISPQRGMK